MSPVLCLVNTNRMLPPIAPIGLDYVASAVRDAGFEVEVLDLCLEDDPDRALDAWFATRSPRLVGVTVRNLDDCVWPAGASFVPELGRVIGRIRAASDAPIVLGGVGFSIAPREILARTGADLGIHGDGEPATVSLLRELEGHRRLEEVPGLLWRDGAAVRRNDPSWAAPVRVVGRRDAVRNRNYFERGGQGGFETKRGCPADCVYCADPFAKGPIARLRAPSDVADEIEALLAQGVDVLHACDAELNLPARHARAVCEEFIRRGLGARVRWYAYLAVRPFDRGLATLLRRAGCIGINFGADSASDRMLAAYGRSYGREDVLEAIRLCRAEGIAVMIDLLLGGPGETPATVGETIDTLKAADPDAIGAAVGVRVYPGTRLERDLRAAGPLEKNPGIRRGYDGPVDLVLPTFYVSPELGGRPADLVRDRIGADPRFFAPPPDGSGADAEPGHNYNDNRPLIDAIAAGARGAYWDILRQLRA